MTEHSDLQSGVMDSDPTQNLQALAVRSTELEVYEALRREIIRGLPPGTSLRLNSLADRFQVSTMPVRASLARLESEGLVVHRSRRGAVVADLTVKDFMDLYAIRMALEGIAARYGASEVSKTALVEMRGQLKKMKAISQQDPGVIDDYLPLDWQLHDLCYQAAGRPRLLRLIDIYRRQSERYFRLYLGHQLDLAMDVKGQTEFVKACEQRDPDRAEAAIRALFAWTTARLLPGLHDDGPVPT